jgi:UDP-glucose 4-epimerase
LPYLVFRFSNVYGRYDNDLSRMVRVIPLFIHSMLREEPITIYGGNQKTLDFTYVDDCVEGIARGIEALNEGRVVNQTINLAYGQGNTLVDCAERIAAELGAKPEVKIAPSLLGEVTHYVADLSKARELLEYNPEVALEEGIARAVSWFQEHRAAHPEENVPVTADHEATYDGERDWRSVAAT